MLDASALVVRGTVETVTPYGDPKLQVFRIKVGRALKGEVGPGDTVLLAQEMLFATAEPYFAPGAESLILAVPLPNYSAFRKILPDGTYWRWTERLDSRKDVAPLADPIMTEAASRYLATRDDAEKNADFLTAAMAGPDGRLRRDALSVIAQRPELPPLLDTGRLQPLAVWLRDSRQPVMERALVIVNLARVAAPGLLGVADELATAPGPLQAPAVDAMVSLGKIPPLDRLMTWSKASDEALRIAASRGLAKEGSAGAVDRLADMLAHDASSNVRVAIVQALAGVRDARVVGLLTPQLASPDKPLVTAAAESLGRIASPEAITALGTALEKGSEGAQAAAAFALRRSNTRDGMEILESQEKTHPDPNVRRLCRLALGESMHEH